MSTILKRTKNAVRRPGRKSADPEPDEVTETEDAEETGLDDEAVGEDAFEDDDVADAADAEDAEDADDEDFGFEDDENDEEPEAREPDRARLRQVLVVMALAALVLAGSVFYLLSQVKEAQATDEAGDAAVSAAKADATDILSYDYRSLDSNFQQGLAATTGGFRTQYQQTTSQLVRPQAMKQKVIVQAAVMNAGLVSATDDNAVVLLFVDRVTTKAGQSKPTFNQDRVRMTMTKVNGKWLVSKLDAL